MYRWVNVALRHAFLIYLDTIMSRFLLKIYTLNIDARSDAKFKSALTDTNFNSSARARNLERLGQETSVANDTGVSRMLGPCVPC